jgi:hypothetical protein
MAWERYIGFLFDESRGYTFNTLAIKQCLPGTNFAQ